MIIKSITFERDGMTVTWEPEGVYQDEYGATIDPTGNIERMKSERWFIRGIKMVRE